MEAFDQIMSKFIQLFSVYSTFMHVVVSHQVKIFHRESFMGGGREEREKGSAERPHGRIGRDREGRIQERQRARERWVAQRPTCPFRRVAGKRNFRAGKASNWCIIKVFNTFL